MEKFVIQKNKALALRNSKGFTLIELMVATSIFMVIMLVALGSLVVTSDSAKKSNALNFTMDNLSFAMESMTRSIRMGTNYYCNSNFIFGAELGTRDCEGETAISFMPAGEELDSTRRVAYILSGDTIQRCDTAGTCVDIIASNIKIDRDSFKFFVRGSDTDNETQASAYVIIKGTVVIKNEPISFAIQTMISQRTAE
jgi:hypothetical protein